MPLSPLGRRRGFGHHILNGLTGLTKTFTTGTARRDFAISSSGTVHTFDLPTASASNRGACSSADWTTFNSKVGGSGTTGYLPKWASSSTLTDSKAFETSNTFSIGTNTGIDTYTRLYIYGGGSGANVDARGLPTTGIDQAVFDAQGSDYATNFRSVHMRYLGVNSVGTTMGLTNVNLGDISFNDPANALIRITNTNPIRLGVNGTEVGQISTDGLVVRTGKELRVYDSDNTQYIGFKTPVTASLTTSYTMTMPVDDGTANQVWQTDGSGVISWATVDLSTTNELQTLANTSNSTTHTVTLSNSGGSLQLAEGTGITLTTTGTGWTAGHHRSTI